MTGALSWRRFAALVRNLPRDSATVRAVGGDDVTWTIDQQMLATVIDLLAGANWQRAGKRGAPRPKPVPRPGDVDNTERFGQGKGMSIEELHERLALAGAEG